MTTTPNPTAERECIMDACEKSQRHRGLCTTHYSRFIDHGDPSWEPPERPSAEQRFWGKVAVADADECWLWQAGKSQGYGRFYLDGKHVVAHRHAWELHHGRPMREGMFACHRCDNPTCVNPAHVFEGTPLDNMRDMIDKGRAKRPTTLSHRGNLRASEVDEIRHLLIADELSLTQIADKFGVRRSTISRIALRKTWATHVTPGVEIDAQNYQRKWMQ